MSSQQTIQAAKEREAKKRQERANKKKGKRPSKMTEEAAAAQAASIQQRARTRDHALKSHGDGVALGAHGWKGSGSGSWKVGGAFRLQASIFMPPASSLRAGQGKAIQADNFSPAYVSQWILAGALCSSCHMCSNLS